MHVEHRDLEPSLLRSFLAVVDEGTVSLAAIKVGITQPALSRRIKHLEVLSEGPLFDRGPVGLLLNTRGKKLVPIARDLLFRSEAAMLLLRNDTTPYSLACPSAVGAAFVAPFIAAGEAAISDVREVDSALVYEELVTHRADIALSPVVPPRSMRSRELFRIPFLLHCPPKSSWSQLERVDLVDLADQRINVSRKGSAVYDTVLARLQIEGVNLELTETSSGITAQALAAGKRELAIGVEPSRFDLVSVPLTVAGEQMLLTEWAAWSPGHYGEMGILELLDRFVAWSQTESPMSAWLMKP